MAEALFAHYNQLLGTPAPRSASVRFDHIGLLTLELLGLTKEDIWAVVRDTPDEEAPQPDGFTGLFYKSAWEVIKLDIISALISTRSGPWTAIASI
jgi:hypothetical protein